MITHVYNSLLDATKLHKALPIVENRMQFGQVLEQAGSKVIVLRHCSPLDFSALLEKANRRDYAIYIYIDTVDGIQADAAGLQFLAERFHITGIISHHPKTLALGKELGLETIQRIFAVDSSGLDNALATVEVENVDLLDIAPAPVIPYLMPQQIAKLPRPFIGSGLITSFSQIQAILQAGARNVAVTRPELWS
jgi:glycerol uptake operon antiterminator